MAPGLTSSLLAAGGAVMSPSVTDHSARGAIHLGRDIADDLDSPGFVGGLDGDDGVFCTDEEFEFVGGHFFRLEA